MWDGVLMVECFQSVIIKGGTYLLFLSSDFSLVYNGNSKATEVAKYSEGCLKSVSILSLKGVSCPNYFSILISDPSEYHISPF